MTESQINWSQKSLDELVDFYYSTIRPAMREVEYEPADGRPSYSWLANHGFSGLSYALRQHHDLTIKEFFIEEVGLGERSDSSEEFDWKIRNQQTVDLLTTYLDTQRDRGGLAESTISSRRYRLAVYVRVYERLHGARNILNPLLDTETRPTEKERCMKVFDRLGERLSTDRSRLKYLGDVQQFYDYLIQFKGAKYNPLDNANKQFRWDADSPNNKTVSADSMKLIYNQCQSIESELLVLALGGWGLRPNEVASLVVDQFVLDDNDQSRIVFQSRKNGPGEVAILYGLDVLKQRIVDLDSERWKGYLFPSSRSSSGHITPQTVNNRFKQLARTAGVAVDGKIPTAKMGRRFWYTTYNEAVGKMMEGLDDIAADQGSASSDVVARNYLSEAEKRKYRRELMQEQLSKVFG